MRVWGAPLNHKHFRRINYSSSNYCFEIVQGNNWRLVSLNVRFNGFFLPDPFRLGVMFLFLLIVFVLDWKGNGAKCVHLSSLRKLKSHLQYISNVFIVCIAFGIFEARISWKLQYKIVVLMLNIRLTSFIIWTLNMRHEPCIRMNYCKAPKSIIWFKLKLQLSHPRRFAE